MTDCSFSSYVVLGSIPAAVTEISDIVLVLTKEFLEIQVAAECRFTLNADVT